MAGSGNRIDRALALLKWPAGLVGLAALPATVVAWGRLAGDVTGRPGPLGLFAAGAAGYVAVWALVLRRPVFGSLLSTLEHEFTHALAAWATGHRVRGLRATWGRGGRIEVLGGMNWVVALAPYFVPTVPLLVAAGVMLLPGEATGWGRVVIGAATAYHVIDTARDVHPRQTDFDVAGRAFTAVFLPPANLLVMGLLLSAAHGGWGRAGRFAGDVVRVVAGWLGWG